MHGKITGTLLSLTAIALFGANGCGADSVAPPAGGDTGTGGSGTSGASTGGLATGGTSGASVGGAVSSGGSSTGGASTGGVSTGGAVATGGSDTGGVVATGGSDTGGVSTGGVVATGGVAGMSTGGIAGMSTGGMGGGANMGGAGGKGGTAGAGNAGGKAGAAGSGAAGASGMDDLNSGPNTMGWIGCSMGENTAAGYRRIGGTRMWGPYGNGGAVVQNWTGNTSSSWQRFDRQKDMYGTPEAVWIMICIFTSGATIQEIRQMVANTKSHAPGAYIYITGQPQYEAGHVCTLAGDGGPELTDRLAQQMAMEDASVHYAGKLGPLVSGEWDGDSCHANTTGQDKLGRQTKGIWGQP